MAGKFYEKEEVGEIFLFWRLSA